VGSGKQCDELTAYSTTEIERWRGKSPFTLTPKELNRAKVLYLKHMLTIREVADIICIPRSSLSRQLRESGIEIKPGVRKGSVLRDTKPLPEDAGKVSDSVIAERLGISRQAVARRRKKLGIAPAHPKKEQAK